MERKNLDVDCLLGCLFFCVIAYGSPVLAYDPLDCLDDIVKVDSSITVGLATKLCSGAWSPEPVHCYGAASKVDDGIIRGIAIDLCAGSIDAKKTLECYFRAGAERKLNRGLSTTLCGAKKMED